MSQLAVNPRVSKWLSRDPLLDAERRQGPNLYEYVKNDPIKLTDFLGLCPCGQHLGFNFSDFSDTVETMTGAKAMDSIMGANPDAPIKVPGPSDFAEDLNHALSYAPGLAEDAEDLNPYLLAYNGAVDLGAFMGSWGCVPDGPVYPPLNPNRPGYHDGMPDHFTSPID